MIAVCYALIFIILFYCLLSQYDAGFSHKCIKGAPWHSSSSYTRSGWGKTIIKISYIKKCHHMAIIVHSNLSLMQHFYYNTSGSQNRWLTMFIAFITVIIVMAAYNAILPNCITESDNKSCLACCNVGARGIIYMCTS